MKPASTRERGVALVCALMLMLAAMMIGVAVARNAFGALAAARGERDRDVARAAAEAALRDAERDIAGTAASSAARAARFDAADVDAFVEGCGHGATDRGLCRATSPPPWQDVDLAEADSDVLVPYGRYTGAVLASGHGLLPVRLPAYLIERLEPGGAAAAQGNVYRISAIGFGTRASTQVVLQSLYRKAAPAGNDGSAGAPGAAAGPGTGGQGDAPVHDGPAPGGASPAGPGTQDPGGGASDGPGGEARPSPIQPPPAEPSPGQPPPHPLPAGRIGWREIANWSELHARVRH